MGIDCADGALSNPAGALLFCVGKIQARASHRGVQRGAAPGRWDGNPQSEILTGCRDSSLPRVWGCPPTLLSLPPRLEDRGLNTSSILMSSQVRSRAGHSLWRRVSFRSTCPTVVRSSTTPDSRPRGVQRGEAPAASYQLMAHGEWGPGGWHERIDPNVVGMPWVTWLSGGVSGQPGAMHQDTWPGR